LKFKFKINITKAKAKKNKKNNQKKETSFLFLNLFKDVIIYTKTQNAKCKVQPARNASPRQQR